MGRLDKGEIDLGGERMIDRIYKRLKPQCARVMISGSHDYGLDLALIPDASSGPKGPAAGLYAVWQYLHKTKCDGFFTVPVDGPDLPQDLCSRLYRAEGSAIAHDENGLHPAFAWWRIEDLTKAWEALNLQESLSLNYLARLTQAKRVKWAGEAMFRNINTPDDLAVFRGRAEPD